MALLADDPRSCDRLGKEKPKRGWVGGGGGIQMRGALLGCVAVRGGLVSADSRNSRPMWLFTHPSQTDGTSGQSINKEERQAADHTRPDRVGMREEAQKNAFLLFRISFLVRHSSGKVLLYAGGISFRG